MPIVVTLCALGWITLEYRSPSVTPALDHLLLVSIDTLRADHLGAYGAAPDLTPTLDALAAEGVVVEHAMATAPTTLASHASLLTGLWPHTHGVPRNGFVLDAEVPTLADHLATHGFHTAGFVGATPLSASTALDRGFAVYDDVRASGHAERTAAEVNRAVFEHLDSAPDGRTFLFVHYYDVHTPYGSPDGHVDDPSAVQAARATATSPVGGFGHVRAVRTMLEQDTPEASVHSQALASLYRSGVRYADARLGELIRGLRRRGLLERTLVLVTADHGEAMNHPEEIWDHGYSVIEDTIHVPLILRFPGRAHAGRRLDDLVSLVDVVPTVCEALGVPALETDGRSVMPALDGRGLAPRSPAFAEATKPWRSDGTTGWANALLPKAARRGSRKVIWEPATDRVRGIELPSGAESAPAPGLVRALHTWSDGAEPPPAVEVGDDVERAQLEALGYTGD